MRYVKLFILAFLWGFSSDLNAQDCPKDYFLMPIKPGVTNTLSGNMGELRPNHFHGGLDIKTDLKTGLPVYAAADGYISRIKVSSFGYGNVIYITHPNKLVTVYAHLDKFNAEIGNYVRRKQYEKETFDIELFPETDSLKVKRGDIIALSGNSGSSAGPHLHFEIRDEKENVLNPMHFDFQEIQDTKAPVIDKIAIRTFGINSRINDEAGRYEFSVKNNGTSYSLNSPVRATGVIGIELRAHDIMDNSSNVYGVSKIKLKLDGVEIFYHNLEKFSFDENRYINVHMDYETFVMKGQKFERCYVADGNLLGTYQKTGYNGKISISDQLDHKAELEISDALGNTTKLNFTIKGTALKQGNITVTPATPVTLPTYAILENILKITVPKGSPEMATLYIQGKAKEIKNSYQKNLQPVFLYDLRDGLPDSCKTGKNKLNFNFAGTVIPGKVSELSVPNMKLKFNENTLYDTLYLQAAYTNPMVGKDFYLCGDFTTPLFGSFEGSFTPENLAGWDKGKTYLFLTNTVKGSKYETGKWDGNQIKFSSYNMGGFIFATDTLKPEIKYLGVAGNTIKFNIFDKNSGISSFRATLNNEWLLMNYDHKRNLIWSERYDKTVPLKGDFVLEVKDQAGNLNTYTIKLP